jgi:hypothetical protein
VNPVVFGVNFCVSAFACDCFGVVRTRLLSVFVNHSGSLFLVFELADCDLKQYMDLRRPHGLDVMQSKVGVQFL